MPIRKKPSCKEFSKLILIVAASLNLFVILFTAYMVWETKDLTPLCYLIPSTAAEVATGTAFYYNKAKAENRLKLMHIYGVPVTEKNFDGGGGDLFDRSDGNYFGGSPSDCGPAVGIYDSSYQAQG